MFKGKKASDLIRSKSKVTNAVPHVGVTETRSSPNKDRSTVDRQNDFSNPTNAPDITLSNSDAITDNRLININLNANNQPIISTSELLSNPIVSQADLGLGVDINQLSLSHGARDDTNLVHDNQKVSVTLFDSSINNTISDTQVAMTELEFKTNNTVMYNHGAVDITPTKFKAVQIISSADSILEADILYIFFEISTTIPNDIKEVGATVMFFEYSETITMHVVDQKSKIRFSIEKSNPTFDEMFAGIRPGNARAGDLTCFGRPVEPFICNDIWNEGCDFTSNLINDKFGSYETTLFINDGRFRLPDILQHLNSIGVCRNLILVDKYGFRFIRLGSKAYINNDIKLLKYDFCSVSNEMIYKFSFKDCFSLKTKIYGSNSSSNSSGVVITGIKDGKAVFNTVPNLVMPFMQIDVCNMEIEGNQFTAVNGLRWLSGLKGSLINLPNLGIYYSVFASGYPIYVRGLSNFGTGILAIAALARKHGSYVVVDDEFVSMFSGDYTSSYYFILGIVPKSLVPIYIKLDYNSFMSYCYNIYREASLLLKKNNVNLAVCSSTGFLARFLSLRYMTVKSVRVGSSFDLPFYDVEGTYKEVAISKQLYGMPGVDLATLAVKEGVDIYVITGFVQSVDCPVFKSIWESN